MLFTKFSTQPLFLQKIFFLLHTFSSLSGTSVTQMLDLLLFHKSWKSVYSFFPSIFSLLVRLDKFYCSVFNIFSYLFSNLLLSPSVSFNLDYLFFKFFNSHLVLFVSFISLFRFTICICFKQLCFIIAHCSIFLMAASRSLLDPSNIWAISVLALLGQLWFSWSWFFVWQMIFFFFNLLYPGHCGYYIIRLWILFK